MRSLTATYIRPYVSVLINVYSLSPLLSDLKLLMPKERIARTNIFPLPKTWFIAHDRYAAGVVAIFGNILHVLCLSFDQKL